MTNTDGRTAVILDPHPLWLDSLALVLERTGVATVGAVTRPREALALVEEHQPSLFVLEPAAGGWDMDAATLCQEARQRAAAVKCIAVGASDDLETIGATLQAGASAYILKSAHPDDMGAAVRQAFEHSIFFPIRVQALGPKPRADQAAASGLTRREQEILLLTAEGLSNAQLARRLWVTEQTVKFHLSNVYKKLAVANRTEAARWAQRNGLLGDRDAEPLAAVSG